MTKPKRRSTKESKPNFVLTLKLDTEKYQEDILAKRLDIGRRVYNACLNELNKRYGVMVESKEYQKAIKRPIGDTTRNRALQELIRKYRQSHNKLANEVISQGTEVYVEEMFFKGLQKRAKKTTKNAKGKTNRKKRFGKSLANKAPAENDG